MPIITMTTPERIKKYRKLAGMTQTDLAMAVNTTMQNISQYERGIRRPKVHALRNLARALNCSIADLVDEYGDLHENEYEPGTITINDLVERKLLREDDPIEVVLDLQGVGQLADFDPVTTPMSHFSWDQETGWRCVLKAKEENDE